MARKLLPVLLACLLLAAMAAPVLASRDEAMQHYKAALALVKTDTAGAESEFRAAIAADGTYVPALLALAGLLAEKGQSGYGEAMVLTNKALTLEPDNFDAHMLLGSCYSGLGGQPNLIKASIAFKEAIKLKPDSIIAYRLLATVYTQIGQIAEANQTYDEAVKRAPKDAMLRFEYGIFLMRNPNTWKESALQLEQAVALDGKKAGFYWALGTVYRRLGRAREAIDQISKALALQPNNYQIMNDLGLAYAYANDLPMAVSWFKQAVGLEQNFALGWYNMACGYALQNKAAQALEALKQAIALNASYKAKAADDPDFTSIRNEAEFKKLIS